VTSRRDERVEPVASPAPDVVDAENVADDVGGEVVFDDEPPDMPVPPARSVYESRGVVTVPVWPTGDRRRP
jgi:hypothetical protein